MGVGLRDMSSEVAPYCCHAGSDTTVSSGGLSLLSFEWDDRQRYRDVLTLHVGKPHDSGWKKVVAEIL